MKKLKNITMNVQPEITELNKLFEDMEKSLFKEYTKEDFEEMESEYKLLEQEKERCNYGR